MTKYGALNVGNNPQKVTQSKFHSSNKMAIPHALTSCEGLILYEIQGYKCEH